MNELDQTVKEVRLDFLVLLCLRVLDAEILYHFNEGLQLETP